VSASGVRNRVGRGLAPGKGCRVPLAPFPNRLASALSPPAFSRVKFWAGWFAGVAAALLTAAAATGIQHAGAPYTIDVWETDEGLPQNSVIAMAQTRDGYLWLGTLNGLVRFDGLRFTVFDESNTPELPSSRIVNLFEDTRSELWIGTETAGALLVSGGRVRPLDIGRGSREGRLLAACEDPAGAVWLYTADGQLCRHRAGLVDVWQVGNEAPSACRAVIADSEGTLWVGNDWSLFSLTNNAPVSQARLPLEPVPIPGKLEGLLAARSGGHWRFVGGRIQKWQAGRLVRDLGPFPWSRVAVGAACEDKNGHLVVGTLGAGLYWFDAEGQATHLSRAEGLSNDYILSLQTDREGSLWIGTDGGGLNRLRRQVFDVVPPTRDRVVQTVSEDAAGGIWIGYNGGGVDYWHNGTAQPWSTRVGGREWQVRAVLADHQGRVWVGTWGGGLLQRQQQHLVKAPGADVVHPVVFSLHEGTDGTIWAGTQGGLARLDTNGWRAFNARDGLPGDGVRAVIQDRDGTVWLGTAGGGLGQFRDGRFVAVTPPDSRPGEDIASLFLDSEGTLWAGTYGRGLLRWKEGRWNRFTSKEGLLSNSVGSIAEDEKGYLWISSNAGVLRVARASFDEVAAGRLALLPGPSYGRSDGLPARECTLGSQPGAWKGRDGRIWIPTIRGLAAVQPSSVGPNTQPPPVTIESVLIDGQAVNASPLRAVWSGTLSVPANRERIEVHFTSVNLAAADRARFRTWLEGHEKGWTDAGSTRVARFSNLSPKTYRLHVTACNEDGVWNPTGCLLTFTVEPPFWRSRWFLALSSLALLGSVVGTVNRISVHRFQRQLRNMEQQQMLERERTRIARDIHDQVGANLTQVALLGELIETDKDFPADVESHAQQIAKTARDTTKVLDEIVWAVNPKNDTLEGLVTYFCKHAQEYLTVAGVRYRYDVPQQIPATPLQPDVRHNVFLAAKEAVTNVVRHAQATEAHVRLLLEEDRFVLEIQDNGRGLGGLDPEAARLRNGLSNMRKRMDDVGGRFTIEPAPGSGAIVRLTCPLRAGGGLRP
jgi:ligand-binding sensor domain-containing protein/signal transduction histidine kinase